MHVLIVEDNLRLASSVKQAMTEQGHSTQTCASGLEAEDIAAGDAYDLYILDVMLPDHSGIDVCRNLRAMGISTPVLMPTALSGTSQEVNGLNAGADDCLTKPLEYDELAARVRALLRRGTTSHSTMLVVGDVELDLSRRTVTRAGKRLRFAAKELALLEYFMRNSHRVVTRTAIIQAVWGTDYDRGSHVVDVYVSNLRKRLAEAGEGQLIHTLVGTGYRFFLDE